MQSITEQKESQIHETPVLLFDCQFRDGHSEAWSTHQITVDSIDYRAAVLAHNAFDLRSLSEDSVDASARLSVTLANADSYFSQLESLRGTKGARLTVRFAFYNLINQTAASPVVTLFRGIANSPEAITESQFRVSFNNRLSLQRTLLPNVRIQKRCPWTFPTTQGQRREAIDGGSKGEFSTFFRCGYSAGETGGVGTLTSATPYTSCEYTRASCEQRGMFSKDQANQVTRRFGGVEFVPSSVLVRGYGDKQAALSAVLENEAKFNDFVPLVYGTAWFLPPVVLARNDGNLTRMEVLLGMGEMQGVLKLLVNGVDIPAGRPGTNMTATGWFNIVSLGNRTGNFNLDFADSSGKPLGDPYGSMVYLSVVVPNRIADGHSLPNVKVLMQGMKLDRFQEDGAYVTTDFNNNPAWILLDVLRRTGWELDELDISSFTRAAAWCDRSTTTKDLNGNDAVIPWRQCNLVLRKRRSAAEIVRGIRTTAGLFLSFAPDGKLTLRPETTLAEQQLTKPEGSNSVELLNGGWPAYEFGDGTNGFSGILSKESGEPSISLRCRSTADTPNRFSVEFQDEFNEYQQDSLSLVDIDDSVRSSQEVTASLTALGIPNFDQATRVTSLQLSKSVRGNVYVDFETSVRAVDLRPGDLITLTYAKEGWDRQPFRVTRIAPGANFRTASITAQLHDDAWYQGSGTGSTGSGRQPAFGVGLPRPLVGNAPDADGIAQFEVVETTSESTDGSVTVQLAVGFVNPMKTLSPGLGIPLVGLNPEIDTLGGTLKGGQNLYYGVTALDSSGGESALSFLVKASIPAGTDTNMVKIPKLSFPASATGFDVYRGTTPAQLLRIAANLPLAGQFVDAGAAVMLVSPPDVNYDHSNFYWRIELQPEEPVNIHSALTIGNSVLNMLPNEYSKGIVRITRGVGAGQERVIAGNTGSTISVTRSWDVEPSTTSFFTVSESSWQFGANGVTSPVSFEVPNRAGTTVQISGRSANVRDDEAAYELSPLTRWRILGAGGTALDGDVPPAPIFGLSPIGQGSIEIQSISFPTLVNTRSANAGTLTVGYWDELNTTVPANLAADIDDAAETIVLSSTVTVKAGDLLQIDSEVVTVQQDAVTALSVAVTRGTYGTPASVHALGRPVYALERKTFVMPFARDFFGSLASGSYAYPVYLPDVRIATAELFVTNVRGSSDVTRRAYTVTEQRGIRTLSGGQLSIQVEGMLAIQANAAPPLSVEAAHAVRDVFATVRNAPTGTPIQLEITKNGLPYCPLTIGVGNTASDPVDGFALGPLSAKALVGLNIVAVSQTADTLPGSDLTVTIRF